MSGFFTQNKAYQRMPGPLKTNKKRGKSLLSK